MARRSTGLQFAIHFRARHQIPPVNERSRCIIVLVLVISASQRLTNFVFERQAVQESQLPSGRLITKNFLS